MDSNTLEREGRKGGAFPLHYRKAIFIPRLTQGKWKEGTIAVPQIEGSSSITKRVDVCRQRKGLRRGSLSPNISGGGFSTFKKKASEGEKWEREMGKKPPILTIGNLIFKKDLAEREYPTNMQSEPIKRGHMRKYGGGMPSEGHSHLLRKGRLSSDEEGNIR